jgi:hypothetical protein
VKGVGAILAVITLRMSLANMTCHICGYSFGVKRVVVSEFIKMSSEIVCFVVRHRFNWNVRSLINDGNLNLLYLGMDFIGGRAILLKAQVRGVLWNCNLRSAKCELLSFYGHVFSCAALFYLFQ